MYHVSLAVKYIYMDAVMKEVKWEWEGGERVKIAWALVCRQLGFVLRVGGRPEDNGGTFCWGIGEEV